MTSQIIKIGSKIISAKSPVFIIAEAGVNHNGRLDLALKLIKAAAQAGADAVKFQTFKAGEVTTAQNKMAEYQKRNIGKKQSQLAMIRELEIPEHWYPKLIKYSQKLGLIFISSPHGHIESADLLRKFKIPAYKIASGDLTNRPLLEHIASFGQPMIISTGMATVPEIEEAVGWIKKAGRPKIAILHCTSNYPCPTEEVNLKAMQTISQKLPGVLIGYSDHTEGYQVSVMATLLGAKIIEKHLTLDKKLAGPDHLASSDLEEFKTLVKAIRQVPVILGKPAKKPTANENKIIAITRKSLITKNPIKKGEKFTSQNLTVKRPGYGLPPKLYKKVLGRTAKRDLASETILIKADF